MLIMTTESSLRVALMPALTWPARSISLSTYALHVVCTDLGGSLKMYPCVRPVSAFMVLFLFLVGGLLWSGHFVCVNSISIRNFLLSAATLPSGRGGFDFIER